MNGTVAGSGNVWTSYQAKNYNSDGPKREGRDYGKSLRLIGSLWPFYQLKFIDLDHLQGAFKMIVSSDVQDQFMVEASMKSMRINGYNRKRKMLMKTGDLNGILKLGLDKDHTCRFCSTESKLVLGKGFQACPNPMCPKPGSWYMTHGAGHSVRSNTKALFEELQQVSDYAAIVIISKRLHKFYYRK